MANIITASQLRSVLGVSSSLYDDAYLNDIIDTAEQVILPLLIQNSTAVIEYELDSNVATFFTRRTHPFVVGQSIVITGLPAPFTATHTLTVVTDSSFSAALTSTNVTRRQIIPNGMATLSGYSAATLYVGNASIESAIYAVSIEVFQSRTAAGGQIEGVDFQSSPYRMGRSLQNRVIGLLGNYIDVDVMIGG
jgi:hypothetical protein